MKCNISPLIKKTKGVDQAYLMIAIYQAIMMYGHIQLIEQGKRTGFPKSMKTCHMGEKLAMFLI